MRAPSPPAEGGRQHLGAPVGAAGTPRGAEAVGCCWGVPSPRGTRLSPLLQQEGTAGTPLPPSPPVPSWPRGSSHTGSFPRRDQFASNLHFVRLAFFIYLFFFSERKCRFFPFKAPPLRRGLEIEWCVFFFPAPSPFASNPSSAKSVVRKGEADISASFGGVVGKTMPR